jgi:hypothetical protein
MKEGAAPLKVPQEMETDTKTCHLAGRERAVLMMALCSTSYILAVPTSCWQS